MSDHPSSPYPKISIVTPSLNQGEFLEQTIQSVLSQDYPNLEYLVMDGGSSDKTLDILRSCSGQVKWVSEKDKGQADAINKGLHMISGEIVAYLNADDLLLSGSLEKVARAFSANPKTMWVTGRCCIITETGQETRKPITAYKNLWLRIHHPSFLFITDYISQPATFWRGSLLNEFGYLDESLHYALDYEFFLRLNRKFPLVILPDYLAAFRVHSQSKNANAFHKNVYVDEDRIAVYRHTGSKTLRALHNIHRWLMTTVYAVMNRG
jgi:glycosyltransferase involved in cell wall biosynthesis